MSETQAEPGLDPDCGQGIHHLIQPAEIKLSRRLFTFHPAGLAAGEFDAAFRQKRNHLAGIEGVTVERFETDPQNGIFHIKAFP